MPPESPLPIEDYAVIGDCNTAALVGRNGSVDWLCWPRFDGAACFAALLGDSDNGRWLLAPVAAPGAATAPATRTYRDGSMVLETVFEAEGGTVAVIDFMPTDLQGSEATSVVRIVEGREGSVAMRSELTLRFDYGASVPWVTRLPEGGGLQAIAGPEMVVLRTPVALRGENMSSVSEFTVSKGERVPFVLARSPSHLPLPPALDAERALSETQAAWEAWSGRCNVEGPYAEAVRRSLIVLKALTFAQTGGIVAAATTSLPEQLGGPRNWDYRFCWLRDATLTLFALMHAGYYDEARSWRDWLHRSIAGSPSQIQIMYGLAGERRLEEWEVPWLKGYQGAAPVRIGNAASAQLQLDVFGEVTDALHQARDGGLAEPGLGWELQRGIVEHLETIWEKPDEGMWEVRGGAKHFTLSKVMVWVALDRSVKDATRYGLDAPVERWSALRDRVHAEICEKGVAPAGADGTGNHFTQYFGSTDLDASLLLIPSVGFLPHDDRRVVATVAAVERDLLQDGFVLRYRTESGADGLPPGEGAFLACTFWLADAYAAQGRHDEAHALFRRLLSLRNDLGLLSEEYDPRAKRLVGNFPQAFSHVALVATALNLRGGGPAEKRGDGEVA